MQNYFHIGRMRTELNHTFIKLIPKDTGANSFSHFRPISLHKIISNLLASRIRPTYIGKNHISKPGGVHSMKMDDG